MPSFSSQSAICCIDESVRSRSAFDAHLNFAAERLEVDRLGQQCLGTVLQRLTLCLRIAIGGNHDDRHVRPRRLRLRG
jgi:hypothetical protein